ncbi:MAG: hypothetical protein IJ145_05230 [Prevotella sp.]|nr:hypothetical protein [Prevotella sp.]
MDGVWRCKEGREDGRRKGEEKEEGGKGGDRMVAVIQRQTERGRGGRDKTSGYLIVSTCSEKSREWYAAFFYFQGWDLMRGQEK